jgi:hypothetical protein
LINLLFPYQLQTVLFELSYSQVKDEPNHYQADNNNHNENDGILIDNNHIMREFLQQTRMKGSENWSGIQVKKKDFPVLYSSKIKRDRWN